MPKRLPNADLRTHEHLTPGEVDRLADTAKGNRHGLRDATMVRVAYQHGLRAAELVGLEWTQVDFNGDNPNVRRKKNGFASHTSDPG
jgi:integrase